MELVPKAEFSIVTRANKAWIPELIAAAVLEVTETYRDFFTATIGNRNTGVVRPNPRKFRQTGFQAFHSLVQPSLVDIGIESNMACIAQHSSNFPYREPIAG